MVAECLRPLRGGCCCWSTLCPQGVQGPWFPVGRKVALHDFFLMLAACILKALCWS